MLVSRRSRSTSRVHTYIPSMCAELHQILDLLEGASGASVTSFRIPATEIKPVITSVSCIGEGATYSDEPYCERSVFEMRSIVGSRCSTLPMTSAAGGRGAIGFNPNKR